MFRVSVVRLVCLIWAIAMPAAGLRAVAGGQRQHRRHGPGRERRGAARASPSPSPTSTPGTTRVGRDQRRRASTARRCCRSAPTRVTAELQGFKKFEQQGITLSAPARPPSINIELEVGNVAETITVTRRVAGRRSRARSTSAGPSARRRSRTCRWSRATPTTSRSSRPTSPATRTTSSACRASTPTARRCTPTIRSTATPTPRRTAPACACCRSRRCWSAR